MLSTIFVSLHSHDAWEPRFRFCMSFGPSSSNRYCYHHTINSIYICILYISSPDFFLSGFSLSHLFARNIQNAIVSYFPSLPPFPFLFFRVTIHPYISTGPLRFCGSAAFPPVTYTYHSSFVIMIKEFLWIILPSQPRLTLEI